MISYNAQFSFFLLLLPLWITSSEYFDPTYMERNRFMALHPSNEWGQQIRLQRNVRILMIGGSNSEGTGCEDNNFVKVLRNRLESMDDRSYIINVSQGGVDISFFIGETYIFETESWASDRWPNVIIIESAINSEGSWITAQYIDNMLFNIFEKYHAKSLPRPDVVFLELFNVFWIVKSFEKNDTKVERIRHLSSFTAVPEQAEMFNRGCRAGPYINALARFYSYPVLSAVDTLWPAFTRFFIQNKVISYDLPHEENNGELTVWPYTSEGVHLSCKGHEFVGNDILIRFFVDQLRPRSSDHPNMNSTDAEHPENEIRMFSPSTYQTLINRWSTWGINQNQLSAITEHTVGWNLTFLDHGNHRFHDGHDCYGARGTTNSKAIFKIPTPRYCQTCKIGISYLHSWNRSYIGNVSCSLYTLPHRNNRHIPSSKSIIANETILINSSIHNGQAVKITAPMETKFETPLRRGMYRVECSKLDDKFACFATINVYLK
mmetsp:Transcript_12055/g.18035  ORF Transcript_12055/g.18035 Transcript_12055/m.18035 type:complete len:491 (-) Transcript_12055:107-1579(-)